MDRPPTDEERRETDRRILEVIAMETKTVMMPRSLTAENGAKAAMMGEFTETVAVVCLYCAEYEPPETCKTCGGEGVVEQEVFVSWTTIKEIYAKAVELLGE